MVHMRWHMETDTGDSRMTPSLFNSTNTADEWHLCNALGKQECLKTLENHWS